MNKEPTQEEMEAAALKAIENFGAPEVLYIPDPDTGEMVLVDIHNPSEEAIEVLYKILKVNRK